MIKKLSNKHLLIILIVLFVAVLVDVLLKSDKQERTFRNVLVSFDTLSVSEIIIYSKANNDKEVRLYKEGEDWKLPIKNNITANIDKGTIKGMLDQLLASKPKRLVAKDKSKWKEFQVDSAGTRVIIKEGQQNH